MDSDKDEEGAGIGPAKQRVVDELSGADDGIAWVTACRTIENYVPAPLLAAATARVHTTAVLAYQGGQYEVPLPSGRPRLDKVKIAEDVCRNWGGTPLLWDLPDMLPKVATLIRVANGLPPASG